MEEPWGTCVAGAFPIANCLHRCNKRQAESDFGCKDVFDSQYPKENETGIPGQSLLYDQHVLKLKSLLS